MHLFYHPQSREKKKNQEVPIKMLLTCNAGKYEISLQNISAYLALF